MGRSKEGQISFCCVDFRVIWLFSLHRRWGNSSVKSHCRRARSETRTHTFIAHLFPMFISTRANNPQTSTTMIKHVIMLYPFYDYVSQRKAQEATFRWQLEKKQLEIWMSTEIGKVLRASLSRLIAIGAYNVNIHTKKSFSTPLQLFADAEYWIYVWQAFNVVGCWHEEHRTENIYLNSLANRVNFRRCEIMMSSYISTPVTTHKEHQIYAISTAIHLNRHSWIQEKFSAFRDKLIISSKLSCVLIWL